MDCIIILKDRTQIGRDAELDGRNVRYRMGKYVITAEPIGALDHEYKLPMYLEASRETLSDDEVIRIEKEEAEKRAEAPKG